MRRKNALRHRQMEMMRESEEKRLLDEPRFNQEDGVEARIGVLIEPVIKELGFRLVRVKLSNQNGLTLQIMMERADGSMTIDDCELLSRTLSPLLDVEDVIVEHYHLEISSPGLDRPMVRRSDFERWKGHLIKVQTRQAIDGQRRFRGFIARVDETDFTLEPEGGGQEKIQHIFSFDSLLEARLVVTDELIRAALVKDKLQKGEGSEADERNKP